MEKQYDLRDWKQFLNEIEDRELDPKLLINSQENARFAFEQIESALQKELAANLDLALPSGFTIGKFKVVKEIGRGGMSTVYLAKRSDDLFDQQVAIKLLSPDLLGEKHEASFDAERKILGRLNHPNISRIIDGGIIPGGVPYLAIEFVEGVALEQHLQSSDLSLKKRLSLFKEICEAVRHAHGHLILHRDLKPDNIILGEKDTIKLLDFGVGGFIKDQAKITSEGGTLRYLPPEHFTDETYLVQSDIYQLGLLGFQILEGLSPLQASGSDEMIEQIKSGISLPWRRYKSDKAITAIIGKCIEVVPANRYESVDALISDVEFYEEDKPIKALPVSWTRNGRLFLKRNRIGAIFSILLFAFVMAFAIYSNLQSRRIAAEKERALAANDFLSSIFEANDPDLNQGEEITAAALLETGERKAGEIENPTVKVDILISLGSLYQSLYLFDRSEKLFTEALSLLDEAQIVDQKVRLAKVYSLLHIVYREGQEFSKADSLSLLSIETLGNNTRKYPLLLAEFYAQRSVIKKLMGDYEDAEDFARSSLDVLGTVSSKDMRKEVFRKDAGYQKISTTMGLIAILGEKSKQKEAVELIDQTMANFDQIQFSDVRQKVTMFNIIGNVYQLTGDYEKQVEFQRKGIDEYVASFGTDHIETLKMLTNLGNAYVKLENFQKSDSIYDFVYGRYIEKLGPTHGYTVGLLYNLANSKLTQGLSEEAIRYLEKVLKADIQNLGEEHPYVGGDHLTLGDAKETLGRYNEALSHYNKALRIFKNAFGEKHRRLGQLYSLMGRLYNTLGDQNRSINFYNMSLEQYEEILGTDHEDYQNALEARKKVIAEQGA